MNKRKVILIDDEPTIIEGFRVLVDWEKHGFTIAGTADDGIMALHLLEEVQPDLAIVDINIPLLSGLNVIEKARFKCPNTRFVIVSGYDDFFYAQQAVKLHAADYILKPVDFDNFEVLLDELYISLLSASNTPPTDAKTDDLILRLISYINNHLNKKITLKQLAAEFHMNPAYLSQYFKSRTGMNYYEYLTHQRVAKAKRLLLTTTLPISIIAEEVGFSSYRVFTATFKKISHILPSEFRNFANFID